MKRHIAAVTVLAAMLVAAPAAALAQSPDPGASPDPNAAALDAVRQATVSYNLLSNAIADGFVPFSTTGGTTPTCFDSQGAGMGVHYVKGVDGTVDANHPEAMVYEVSPFGDTRLVAVEYVVPQELVEDEQGNVQNLPELFGQKFHKNPTLPLYILHAWIWEANPDGMFADFNPRVLPCATQ